MLSGGRAELGIGAAWYEREHHGLGVPFPPLAERFERLEEAIQICLQMWSDDDGPFDGRHYQLAETLCRPAPVSSPRPRIMIGGGGERKTLRLVAQYADACNLFGGPTRSPTRSTCCAATATRSGATRTRSRSRRCSATCRRTRRVDDVVRGAEAFAAVGVSTLVTGAIGDDPAGWLESTFGPAMERLGELRERPSRRRSHGRGAYRGARRRVRLLDGVGPLALEQVRVIASDGATHVRYRVTRRPGDYRPPA